MRFTPETDASEVEPLVRLHPARTAGEGLGGSLFGAGLGAAFLGAALWRGLHGREHGPVFFADVLLLLIGALFVVGGVSHVVSYVSRALRLGRPSAFLIPSEVRPGERFRFIYRQPVEVPLTAVITVAFVLREEITTQTDEGPRTTHHDHLVNYFREERVRVSLREGLEREYAFQVPEAGSWAFPVGEGPVCWLVKVHVALKRRYSMWGYETGMWKEYEVTVLPVPTAAELVVNTGETEGYEVVLVRDRILSRAVFDAVAELMPYLSLVQLHALRGSLPAFVLRGVTRDEAEAARTLLERAGAGVEVRRGGEVVEKRDYPDLPIPGGSGEREAAKLPLPASDRGSPPETHCDPDDSAVA